MVLGDSGHCKGSAGGARLRLQRQRDKHIRPETLVTKCNQLEIGVLRISKWPRLVPHKPPCSPSGSTPVVEVAISREKEDEKTRQQLEGATLVAGIKYGGSTVKQSQTLRKPLPEDSTLIVAKNKLIGKAIEGTKWQALEPALKGMNAWLFVHSDEIPAVLKPYRYFHKELKVKNDFTGRRGAVFEGKFYAPDQVKELESMPARAELLSKLFVSIQAPATNLVGTLQGPGH